VEYSTFIYILLIECSRGLPPPPILTPIAIPPQSTLPPTLLPPPPTPPQPPLLLKPQFLFANLHELPTDPCILPCPTQSNTSDKVKSIDKIFEEDKADSSKEDEIGDYDQNLLTSTTIFLARTVVP